MNLHQFLLALRGRLWVFLSLLGATVAAAVVVTLLMPKTYEATASILLDNRDEQSLSGTVPSARERIGFMQTQMDIIQSQRVARRVVEDLKLAEGPAMEEAFTRSRQKGTKEDWVASGLLAGLKVNSSQSSVVQLTYVDRDPKFAAQVANALMDLEEEPGSNIDQAMTLISRATELNPGSAFAWFISGVLCLIDGDGDRAVDHLQRAIRLDPVSPLHGIASAHLGLGLAVQGRYAESVRILRASSNLTARAQTRRCPHARTRRST